MRPPPRLLLCVASDTVCWCDGVCYQLRIDRTALWCGSVALQPAYTGSDGAASVGFPAAGGTSAR